MKRYGVMLVAVVAGVTVFLSCQGTSTRGHGFVVKPYIQNLTSRSVVVMWETAGNERGVVEVGKRVFRAAPSLIHEVKVTGLEPATPYTYRVNRRAGGRFTTLPEGEKKSVTVVIYGDSRTFPDTHREVAALIRKENPVLFIHTGDLVTDGHDKEQWAEQCFGPLEGTANNYCMFPVLGNHEGNSPWYYAYFSLPGEERWYSVDVGSVHFVMLDSNAWGEEMERQLRWLAADLKKDTHRWKMAVFHHPPFACSRRGMNGRVVKEILPLLYKGGVQFVFSGHDHYYMRSKPLYDADGNVIVFFISGGGGAPLKAPEEREFTACVAETYHVCVLRISPDAVEGRVVAAGGDVVDTFRYEYARFKKYGRRKGLSVEMLEATFMLEGGFKIDARVEGPVRPNRVMKCTVTIPPLYMEDMECTVRWNREKTTWHVKPKERRVTLDPEKETRLVFFLDYWGSVYPAVEPEIVLKRGEQTYTVKADLVLPAFRETTILEMTSFPRIDGVIEKKEVKGLKLQTGFVDETMNREAEVQTRFYAGVVGRSLYFAVENLEPEMDKVKPPERKRDGKVWADDCDEFFIQIPGRDHYFHFIVNAAGQVYDAKDKDTAWNATWQAAVKRLKDRWNVEVLIPIEVLGKVLGPGEDITIRMNVCRNRPHQGEYSQWSRTYGSSHRPEFFGTALILRK